MRFFIFIAIWILSAAAPALANQSPSAVIFIYHRFGENNYPSTNVTVDQFESHIRELTRGGYHVWPVPKIIDYLKNGRDMPQRVVGITIDDAPVSVYRTAWPILRDHKIPFTLFIATDDIDRNSPAYVTWDMVRDMQRGGLMTVGNHTKSHPHMTKQTMQQNAAEIIASNRRIAEELGVTPELFAYPYGEYGSATQKLARDFGFTAAFGQYSGVAHSDMDFFAVPRFALNENYGHIDRFIEAARAAPLKLRLLSPNDPVLTDAKPQLVLAEAEPGAADGMTCYASDFGRVHHRAEGDRIIIELPTAWETGRARLNCTKAAKDENGKIRWQWWGAPFLVP